MPEGHALAGARPAVPLKRLAEETFVVNRQPRPLAAIRDDVVAACRAAGFRPRVGPEAPNVIPRKTLGFETPANSYVRCCSDRLSPPPNSGHWPTPLRCPLWANSGLMRCNKNVGVALPPAHEADVAFYPSCQRDVPNSRSLQWAARVPTAGIKLFTYGAEASMAIRGGARSRRWRFRLLRRASDSATRSATAQPSLVCTYTSSEYLQHPPAGVVSFAGQHRNGYGKLGLGERGHLSAIIKLASAMPAVPPPANRANLRSTTLCASRPSCAA